MTRRQKVYRGLGNGVRAAWGLHLDSQVPIIINPTQLWRRQASITSITAPCDIYHANSLRFLRQGNPSSTVAPTSELIDILGKPFLCELLTGNL